MGYLLVERAWDCCEELNRVFENAFIPDMNESISVTVYCLRKSNSLMRFKPGRQITISILI